MTDTEKKLVKEGVISIFDNFNIFEHTTSLGGLRDDILRLINSMPEESNSETLGAHLRNLLSPYKTLLCLVKDVTEGKMDLEVLRKYKCDNISDIIEFSKSEEMESNIWRK